MAGNRRDLVAIYKGQITQALNEIPMNDSQRGNVQSLVIEALDNMMPLDKVEETKLEEDNVVCKLLLKGHPNSLFRAIEPIIKSLNILNKNGNVDLEQTPQYVMTLMLEKTKKA